MKYNLDFLKDYDKNLLLLSIDHYKMHIHPEEFSGSQHDRRLELLLISDVREKISSSDFDLSKREALKFEEIIYQFNYSLSLNKVDDFQEEKDIDRIFSLLKKLHRQVENVLF